MFLNQVQISLGHEDKKNPKFEPGSLFISDYNNIRTIKSIDHNINNNKLMLKEINIENNISDYQKNYKTNKICNKKLMYKYINCKKNIVK